jgi:hypothetical protein
MHEQWPLASQAEHAGCGEIRLDTRTLLEHLLPSVIKAFHEAGRTPMYGRMGSGTDIA